MWKRLWRLPDELLKNKEFKEKSEKKLRSFNEWTQEYQMEELLCENEQEVKALRKEGQNPQAKWKKVKEDIKEIVIRITNQE